MWIRIVLYDCGYKSEVSNVTPPMGRPTNDPKNLSTRIRLSEADIKMLEYCSKATGKPKAEIIRLGIREIYRQLKK